MELDIKFRRRDICALASQTFQDKREFFKEVYRTEGFKAEQPGKSQDWDAQYYNIETLKSRSTQNSLPTPGEVSR